MKKLECPFMLTRIMRSTVAAMLMICFFQNLASANDIHVSARPGGVYNLPAQLNDTKIIIDGSGSSGSPFTVMGVANKTVMKGNSSILMAGNYITVQNVSFVDNIINFLQSEALVQFGTKKNIVTGDAIRNCDFAYTTDFDDRDKETQFYWVEIYGKNNTVDNSTFTGKQNRLPVVSVNSHSWTGENNTVSNCTFHDVKARKGEALEAIRVGLGNSRSNCRIFNNKFINYFGDSETISCKSNGVFIEGNTFTNCRSGVSLRLSDSSTIKNNKFNTRAGVRLCGVGHIISNNVFDSPDNTSIIFMKGGDACNYKNINGVDISDNVFMNRFELRVLETKYCKSMPQGIQLHHNFVYNNGLFKCDDDNSDDVFKTVKAEDVNVGDNKASKFNMSKLNPANEDNVMKKVRDYQARKQQN